MSDVIPVVPVVPVVPPTPSPPLPPKKVNLPAWIPASIGSLLLGGIIGAVIVANLPQNAPAPVIPEVTLPDSIVLDPSGAPTKLQATLKNKNDVVTWLVPKWVRTSSKYKNFEYADHQLLSGTGGDYDIFAVIEVKGKPVIAETHVVGSKGPTPTPPTPTPPVPPTPVPPTPVPPSPPAPVDPLTKSFQDAYNLDTDTDKAKSLAFLQAIYPAMASGFPSPPPATNSALLVWMKSRVESPGVGLTATQLVSLRKTIGAELASSFGTDPSILVNVTTAPAELRTIGTALSNVK